MLLYKDIKYERYKQPHLFWDNVKDSNKKITMKLSTTRKKLTSLGRNLKATQHKNNLLKDGKQ